MENPSKEVMELAIILHELARPEEIYAAIQKAFDEIIAPFEQRILTLEELCESQEAELSEIRERLGEV